MSNVFILALDDRDGERTATVRDAAWELEKLFSMIPATMNFREALMQFYPRGICYAWCLWNAGTGWKAPWHGMEEGDLVLGYSNRSIMYAASILLKANGPFPAVNLPDGHPEGSPELIWFTDKPHVGEVPIVPQMSRYLGGEYLGVTKLEDANVRNILSDYGSLDTFVHLCLRYDFPFSLRHS
ncbi:MAG: hypothetical protein M0Q23_00965 [Syntrophales bacterium]|jgi:hypothetical protein|nr:hypothetical protein [Syntrophales bacterium]MCK9527219.1 hypothetical protein [Syntrophales bacterium]MDX9921311.1 hypothetical protein [Syntrophales bacterium]